MNQKLIDLISLDGTYTLYGLPTTTELRGRTARLPDGTAVRFGGELAVKCDDDLFLAEQDGKLLLVEELADESLRALDAEAATAGASALPEPLEGWDTELSFASGYVLKALFRDGTLTLAPSPEPEIDNPYLSPDAPKPKAPDVPPVTLPLRAVEIGEKRFLLRFPERGEIVFLNARRFLLYALLSGRVVTGYVDVPPRPRKTE